MIQICDLIVEKGGRTICHVEQFAAARGEQVAVLGSNGSGKTTLLRVLAGLEHDFTGRCEVDVPVGSRVYVHQAPYLFRGSALFNAAYGLAAQGVAKRERQVVAKKWLDDLGVGSLANRQCSSLSGGEQRRVALARAFATKADLLLLDEPLADLDPKGIEFVNRALAAVEDSTVLISSPVPLHGIATTLVVGG